MFHRIVLRTEAQGESYSAASIPETVARPVSQDSCFAGRTG